MLAAFRSAVLDVVTSANWTDPPGIGIFRDVPDDVADLPAVIVGYPAATETADPFVFELSTLVTVIGRRTDAGDADDELFVLADDAWTAFDGVRSVRAPSGTVLEVTSVDPRTVTIAGLEFDAYQLSIRAHVTHC